jgi:hypothetical protein
VKVGACERCSTPYGVAEVAHFGILRPRTASRGGPLLEYRCPRCGATAALVPHGRGRYAPLGAPPPAEAPAADDLRPPWAEAAPAGAPAPEAPDASAGDTAPGPAAAGPAEAPGAAGAPASGDGAPLGVAEALAILGVGPEASAQQIEEAYRARALGCHPDKVAHLDAEFQALAERKFRRLREAYDLLR